MKKTKALWLVLALVIVLHSFSIYPVVAESEAKNAASLGQLDAVDQGELERYPDKIPTEIISQEQIEQLGHTRRLPQAEGDMQTIMLGNADGTNSLYIFSYPVKYTDSQGRIRDKSNRLSAHEKADYAYINAENDIQTHLPDDVTQDPIVLTYGEYAIYTIPVAEASSSVAQKDTNDIVTYPEVFGDGTVLRYQVDFNGYKEDIIIDSENASTEFSFYMFCVGLEPVIQEGVIAYVDSDSGETVFSTSPFYVYDSAAQTNGYTDTDFTLIEMKNSVYKLTVDVDEDFLDTKNLTYPIYVDPSLTFTSSSYVDTATVYKNASTTPSAGGAYGYVGYMDSTHGEARMLIRFTDLRDNFIFRNLSPEQIGSVNLYMYSRAYGTSSGNICALIRRALCDTKSHG